VSVESSPDRSSERQDAAAASTGWDPYEVWRTRVLQVPASDATGKSEPPPRPFLIRAR
jgi:hypothetical protein